MQLHGSRLQREFRRICPDRVLAKFGTAILNGYRRNSPEAKLLCPEIRQYHAGQTLRVRCEQAMAETAAELSPEVVGAWSPNRKNNYSFYRVVVGGATAVTQHRVADIGALPRESEWRMKQAEQQYALTLPGVPFVLAGGGHSYALITHGSRSAAAAAPDFIRVRFPLAGGGADDGFIDVLDLMARLQDERQQRMRIEHVAQPKATPKARPGTAS